MLVNVFDGNWNGGYLVDGGRNLLIGSSISLSAVGDAAGTTITKNKMRFATPIENIQVYRNKKCTISCMLDIEEATALSGTSGRAGVEVSFNYADKSIKTTWCDADRYFSNTPVTLHDRVFRTYQINDSEIESVYAGTLYIQKLASGTASVSKAKIELGTVATPWTPAPEDTFEEGTKHPNSIFTNTIPVKKKYQYTYGFLNQNSLPAHTIRYMKPDG